MVLTSLKSCRDDADVSECQAVIASHRSQASSRVSESTMEYAQGAGTRLFQSFTEGAVRIVFTLSFTVEISK